MNSCVYLIIPDHMFISQYLVCLLSFVILLFLNLSDWNNLNYMLQLGMQIYIYLFFKSSRSPQK